MARRPTAPTAADDFVPRPGTLAREAEAVARAKRDALLRRREAGDAEALRTPLPQLAADATMPACGRPH